MTQWFLANTAILEELNDEHQHSETSCQSCLQEGLDQSPDWSFSGNKVNIFVAVLGMDDGLWGGSLLEKNTK